jgi:23S rRNA (guanosine2251-2'-O)-methyltransferase
MWIYGINPVIESLRAGRATRIRVAGRGNARIAGAVDEARARGVPVDRVEPAALDRLAGGAAHQGIAAEVGRPRPLDLADLVAGAKSPALLLVLDGIEDPQNLGAILRTADAAGVDGIVRQTRHAAPLAGAAVKASAGAAAHVRLAEVVNIARAVDELKDAGIWTVGLASEAEQRYDRSDLTVPVAFVVGAEGAGLRRLVRERCDWLVSIPMHGHVGSLNVSVAAGIVLFEARRQRAGRNG